MGRQVSTFGCLVERTVESRDLPTHATEEYLEGKVSAEEMMTAKNRSETIQPQVASPVSPVDVYKRQAQTPYYVLSKN